MFYPPQSRAVVAQAAEKLQAKGEPFDLELPFDTADGTRLWVWAAGAVESHSGSISRVYGTFQDITQRRLQELTLAGALGSLQSTIAAIPDILFETDAQGDSVSFNFASANPFGVDPDVLLGRTSEEVLRPEIAAVIRAVMADVEGAGSVAGHILRIDEPGGAVWFELSAAERTAACLDLPGGFMFLARNITLSPAR